MAYIVLYLDKNGTVNVTCALYKLEEPIFLSGLVPRQSVIGTFLGERLILQWRIDTSRPPRAWESSIYCTVLG